MKVAIISCHKVFHLLRAFFVLLSNDVHENGMNIRHIHILSAKTLNNFLNNRTLTEEFQFRHTIQVRQQTFYVHIRNQSQPNLIEIEISNVEKKDENFLDKQNFILHDLSSGSEGNNRW